MTKQLIIITQPNCSPCKAVKKWLEQNHISFEEIDFIEDTDKALKLNDQYRLGSSTPQILFIYENSDLYEHWQSLEELKHNQHLLSDLKK